jgi:hypothetical protein
MWGRSVLGTGPWTPASVLAPDGTRHRACRLSSERENHPGFISSDLCIRHRIARGPRQRATTSGTDGRKRAARQHRITHKTRRDQYALGRYPDVLARCINPDIERPVGAGADEQQRPDVLERCVDPGFFLRVASGQGVPGLDERWRAKDHAPGVLVGQLARGSRLARLCLRIRCTCDVHP